MLSRNNVPILAPIVETIVAILMFILVFRVWQRYINRKREATAYLSICFTSYATGMLLTAIGKWLQFGLQIDPEVTSYADFFILLAYTFTALSNVFLFAFVNEIFLGNQARYLIPITILNSISIGLFIPRISLRQGSYSEAFLIVLYHAFNTIIIMVLLIWLSLRERRKIKERIPRVGFLFITLYGIFDLLLFVSFGIDVAILLISEKGYSPFYYLSWFFAFAGLASGYLGYIMPDWFRKIVT